MYQVLAVGNSLSHGFTLSTYVKKGHLLFTLYNNKSAASVVCKIRIHNTPNMPRLCLGRKERICPFLECLTICSLDMFANLNCQWGKEITSICSLLALLVWFKPRGIFVVVVMVVVSLLMSEWIPRGLTFPERGNMSHYKNNLKPSNSILCGLVCLLLFLFRYVLFFNSSIC